MAKRPRGCKELNATEQLSTHTDVTLKGTFILNKSQTNEATLLSCLTTGATAATPAHSTYHKYTSLVSVEVTVPAFNCLTYLWL